VKKGIDSGFGIAIIQSLNDRRMNNPEK